MAQRNLMSMRAQDQGNQTLRVHEGGHGRSQTTLHDYAFRERGGEAWARGPPTRTVSAPMWWKSTPMRPPNMLPHRDKEITQCCGAFAELQRYAWVLEPHTLNKDTVRQMQAIMISDTTGVVQSWMRHSVDLSPGQRGAFHLIQIDYSTYAIRSCTGGVFHPRISRSLRFQLTAASALEIDVCPPSESIFWTALSCVVVDEAERRCMHVHEAMGTWIGTMKSTMRSFHELVWAATWDQQTLEQRARRLGVRVPDLPD